MSILLSILATTAVADPDTILVSARVPISEYRSGSSVTVLTLMPLPGLLPGPERLRHPRCP